MVKNEVLVKILFPHKLLSESLESTERLEKREQKRKLPTTKGYASDKV